MGRFIALFQGQAEATHAVDELHRLGLPGLDTAVYEGPRLDEDRGRDVLAGTGGPPGSMVIPTTGGMVPLAPLPKWNIKLDPADEEFLQQGFSRGGTIVVTEFNDNFEPQVRKVIIKHGGRFS